MGPHYGISSPLSHAVSSCFEALQKLSTTPSSCNALSYAFRERPTSWNGRRVAS